MSTTKIMTDNFLDEDILNQAFISSEQSAFPDENLYETQRRSKVWRSNGYWDITSSNNSLTFRETAAIDLVATIAVAEYSSDATFFSAIKSALETAGGSTYTIERDTNSQKIKFTSDGAGGGGILELRWTVSTALATLVGFDTGSDDTGFLTYTADVLKLASEEWIKWDMGISSNPKAFLLIDKRNEPIPLSPSGTYTLQGSETDAWDTPSFETTITYDERVMLKYATTGFHTGALRYWRFLMEDQSNANGYLEVGAVYLGDFFTPSRGAIQFPMPGEFIDRSTTVFSEGGQSFSDIREKAETFDLSWRGLNVADKEEFDAIFDKQGTSLPFFISIDPDAANSSDGTTFTRYVKFESAPRWRLVSPQHYEMTTRVREQL